MLGKAKDMRLAFYISVLIYQNFFLPFFLEHLIKGLPYDGIISDIITMVTVLGLGFFLIWLYREEIKKLLLQSFRWSHFGWIMLTVFLFFLWAFVTTSILNFPRTANATLGDNLLLTANGFRLVLLLFESVVWGPIIEEIMTRAIPFILFRDYQHLYLDVLVSATLFATIHVITKGFIATDFIEFFGFGLIFALLLKKTSSLYVSAFCHVLWNAFVTIVIFYLY